MNGIATGRILCFGVTELTFEPNSAAFELVTVSSVADCQAHLADGGAEALLVSLDDADAAEQLIDAVAAADADLPIVLIAQEGQEALIARLLDSGATDFLRYAEGQGALLQRVLARNIGLARYQAERREAEAQLARLNRQLSESINMLERDQRAGFRVQEAILPPTPQELTGLSFSFRLHPSLILSGDFVDYFVLPDGRVVFYLADVAGHGTSSAFVTILLKSLVRKLQYGEIGVAPVNELLDWLNREVLFCQIEHHVTMFLGMIDPRTGVLEYSNAAQFPAPVCVVDDEAVLLELGHLPLGLSESAEYDCGSLKLGDSFGIAIFSDGVLEILAEDSVVAREERLVTLVNYAVSSGTLSASELVTQLGMEARETLPDDVAVLTVTSEGFNGANKTNG